MKSAKKSTSAPAPVTSSPRKPPESSPDLDNTGRYLAEQLKTQAAQLDRMAEKIAELERSLVEEKLRAQKELDQAENRFTAFMTYTPALVWINDRDGNLVYNNKVLGKQNPLQPEELNIAGLVPQEVARQYQENNRQVIETGAPLQAVEPILLEDGSLGQALVYKFPIPDPDSAGEVLVGGVGIDITQQFRVQEQLRQSEEHYRLVVDNLKEIVFQADFTGRFLYLNPAWTAVTGFDREETVGRYFLDFVHPDDRAHNLELFLPLIEGKKEYCRHEIRYLTVQGGFRWLEVFAQTIRGEDGNAEGIGGTFNDITVRRETEELLQIRAVQQQALADLSSLALQDLELDYFLLRVTDRVALTLNTPFTQVVESLPDGKAFRLKAGAGWEMGQINSFKREGGPTSISNYTLQTRKPVLVDYLNPNPAQIFSLPGPLQDKGVTGGLCVPIFNLRQKEPFGVLSAYTLERKTFTHYDINFLESIASLIAIVLERKKVQEESLTMERQFLQAQKMESLGVLAGGIAHDFNNLLGVILGNTEIAQFMLEESAPAAAYLEKSVTAIQRAADLVQQLLAYAGKTKFQAAEVDLNSLIVDMTGLLNLTLTNNIALNYELAPDLPLVTVDATQMRQIIMNLLSNSTEAIGTEQGTITLKTGVRQVDRAFLEAASTFLGNEREEKSYNFLQVTDSGAGMDRATLERIFEPFFTTKFTGRGLGLSAVLGIIRSHQGILNVVSIPGQGTTFTVLLPLSSSEVETASAAARNILPPIPAATLPLPGGKSGIEAKTARSFEASEKISSGPTILVVEDEEVLRETTARILNELNYRTITAPDGLSGLDVYREKSANIDCVILDLVMPRIGGDEVLRELLEINPQAKVIIMSGYSEEALNNLQNGNLAYNFLQKPFTIEALKTVLKATLEEKTYKQPL